MNKDNGMKQIPKSESEREREIKLKWGEKEGKKRRQRIKRCLAGRRGGKEKAGKKDHEEIAK